MPMYPRQKPGGSSLDVLVEDHGSTIGDATAAIRAAAKKAVEERRRLAFVPGKDYAISDVIDLNVPTPASGEKTAWSLEGHGSTKIRQQLNNAPVFRINGNNPNGFGIYGLDLVTNTPQPKTATQAMAVMFNSQQAAGLGVGTWNFRIEDLKIDGFFRGIGQEKSAGASKPVWGAHLAFLRGGFLMSGALVHLQDPGGAGAPNVSIRACYIRRNDTMTDQEASIVGRFMGVKMDNIEINGGSNRVIFLQDCPQFEIGLIHLEDIKTTLFGEPMILLAGANGEIHTIDAGLIHFDGANNGSPALLQANLGSRVTVTDVIHNVGRVGAGTTPAVIRGAATAPNEPASVYVHNVTQKGAAIAQFVASEPWTRYKLRLGSELRRRLVSSNRGDAAAVLTDSDDEVQRFATPLTADRLVTLPAAPAKRRYRIVRTAAATGAFNLSVGGLRNLAAGQWCDVEWDGAAWLVTAFGAL